jgi:hypothetical protein
MVLAGGLYLLAGVSCTDSIRVEPGEGIVRRDAVLWGFIFAHETMCRFPERRGPAFPWRPDDGTYSEAREASAEADVRWFRLCESFINGVLDEDTYRAQLRVLAAESAHPAPVLSTSGATPAQPPAVLGK